MNRKQKQRLIAQWCAAYGQGCFWCGRLFGVNDMDRATVDHFFPLSRGGAPDTFNCVVAHQVCNSAKGQRIPNEDEMRKFLVWRGNHARSALWHYGAYLRREIGKQQRRAAE